LENLVTIRSDLVVENNESLVNFKGLDNFVSDLQGIGIYNNPALKSLDGLEKLNSIEKIISITYNSSLTTLYGLHNVNLASLQKLILLNNPLLSVCDFPNICSYLEAGNTFNIGNNAEGCDGFWDIRTSCLPEIESVLTPASVVIE